MPKPQFRAEFVQQQLKIKRIEYEISPYVRSVTKSELSAVRYGAV